MTRLLLASLGLGFVGVCAWVVWPQLDPLALVAWSGVSLLCGFGQVAVARMVWRAGMEPGCAPDEEYPS